MKIKRSLHVSKNILLLLAIGFSSNSCCCFFTETEGKEELNAQNNRKQHSQFNNNKCYSQLTLHTEDGGDMIPVEISIHVKGLNYKPETIHTTYKNLCAPQYVSPLRLEIIEILKKIFLYQNDKVHREKELKYEIIIHSKYNNREMTFNLLIVKLLNIPGIIETSIFMDKELSSAIRIDLNSAKKIKLKENILIEFKQLIKDGECDGLFNRLQVAYERQISESILEKSFYKS